MNKATLVEVISAMSPTDEIDCFAPAKLTNQSPVIKPEVAIPQNA